MLFISFFLFTYYCKSLNIILNKNWEIYIFVSYLILEEFSLTFFLFIIMFAVDLLLHFFIMKVGRNLSKVFSTFTGMITQFLCLYLFICYALFTNLYMLSYPYISRRKPIQLLGAIPPCWIIGSCWLLWLFAFEYPTVKPPSSERLSLTAQIFFNRFREREIHWLQLCSHWWPRKTLVDNSNPGIT